jgi:cobalt-zinc-cadmium efflux system outer membrane protein
MFRQYLVSVLLTTLISTGPAGYAMEPSADDVAMTEPNEVMTLGRALALTLMHNPALKAYSLEMRAAEARSLQAGLWPNPEIGVEVEEAGGSGARRGFDAAQTTIRLSQLIEMGDKAGKRKRVAAFEEELTELEYQSRKLDVFSAAAKAFVSVVEAQEKLVLSNELLGISEASFDAVEKRVAAGRDSELEKTRASVALAGIRISNGQARRALKHARDRLGLFWGQDEVQFGLAAGDLYGLDRPPRLEDVTERLNENPDYIGRQKEVGRRGAMLDMEKAKGVGDITIAAGTQRFNETDDNAFVFGFSIPLPVSDRNQGSRQEAVHNLAISRHRQRAALLELQNELSKSHQGLVDSYSRAVSLKTEVLPAAERMFNAAVTAYREGKTGYLSVLDAQRTYFMSQTEYLEALVAYHKARTDMDRLVGQSINKESFQQ